MSYSNYPQKYENAIDDLSPLGELYEEILDVANGVTNPLNYHITPEIDAGIIEAILNIERYLGTTSDASVTITEKINQINVNFQTNQDNIAEHHHDGISAQKLNLESEVQGKLKKVSIELDPENNGLTAYDIKISPSNSNNISSKIENLETRITILEPDINGITRLGSMISYTHIDYNMADVEKEDSSDVSDTVDNKAFSGMARLVNLDSPNVLVGAGTISNVLRFGKYMLGIRLRRSNSLSTNDTQVIKIRISSGRTVVKDVNIRYNKIGTNYESFYIPFTHNNTVNTLTDEEKRVTIKVYKNNAQEMSNCYVYIDSLTIDPINVASIIDEDLTGQEII